MVLDVVAFSRMMAGDERGTLARVLELQRGIVAPFVAQHEGRIVKLMGDGVLAEFASVTSAVECARAIQQAMERDAGTPPMRLRIGINLGEVIVEGDDIFGDGVNVAARLEGLAEPGGVALSKTAYEQVKGQSAFGFADTGLHSVKNIPEPVRVFQLRPAGAGRRRLRIATRRNGMLAGFVLALAVSLVGALTWRDRAGGTTTMDLQARLVAADSKPSVAVLPFENLSQDPEQAYFSDGIAQNLITDLSKVSGLLVIARNTSFSFRDHQADAPTIGRELGVRYVVDGSVQKLGGTVRINASLTDTGTGYQVWAGKMDRPFEDLFALQDEVAAGIIDALHLELTNEERRRLSKRYTNSLEAYDLYLRAWEEIWRFNEDSRLLSQVYLRRALEVDPKFALARAILATSYTNRNGVTIRANEDSLDIAYRLAQEAVQDDPDLPAIHGALGIVHMFRREFDAADAAFERAIELDPNYADAYAMQAWNWNYAGDPEKAQAGFDYALKLNPRPPFPYLNAMAEVQFSLGHYDKSLELNLEALRRNPAALRQHLFVAAAYAETGRLADAEWEVQEVMVLQPELTLRALEFIAPFRDREVSDRLTEALRRAGLPE